MSLDLSKVSPAPWFVTGMDVIDDQGREKTDVYIVNEEDTWIAHMIQKDPGDDPYMIALSRNILDILMRRGWSIVNPSRKIPGKWHVYPTPNGIPVDIGGVYDNPFEAVYEADEWMKRNEDEILSAGI